VGSPFFVCFFIKHGNNDQVYLLCMYYKRFNFIYFNGDCEKNKISLLLNKTKLIKTQEVDIMKDDAKILEFVLQQLKQILEKML